jgi:hypothetical protein
MEKRFSAFSQVMTVVRAFYERNRIFTHLHHRIGYCDVIISIVCRKLKDRLIPSGRELRQSVLMQKIRRPKLTQANRGVVKIPIFCIVLYGHHYRTLQCLQFTVKTEWLTGSLNYKI